MDLENNIFNLMGYKKGTFSCKYLGMTIEKGAHSFKSLDTIITKLDSKINSWLSSTKRATMIKVVLSAIPIYQMYCLPLSHTIKTKLTKELRTFFGKVLQNTVKFL